MEIIVGDGIMNGAAPRTLPLDRALTGRAAEVMLCAYRRDPLMDYVVPELRRDTRKTLWIIETALRYGMRYGRVDTNADVSGVAVWLPPDHPEMTLWGLLMTGLLFAPLHLGRAAFGRLARCVEYTHQVHHEAVPCPHWYLYELAVEPVRQGTGIGSSLIRPVLDLADADSLPCFCETYSERAVGFYLRHGFRVAVEGEPPGGGPKSWAMLREPR